MEKSPSHTFNEIAEVYATSVDAKPIHVFYERPHTWDLLPPSLQGKKVLDLGCGSGWYSEQLLKASADVTAIDASPKMVELTKNRLQGKGNCVVADLEKPLDFLQTDEFDVVVAPLVIHYIRDWGPLFLEISRILKPQGIFIFSTHQPHTEYFLFKLENYFNKVLIKDFWEGINKEVTFYHHTLHELAESLHQANFVIERMMEPLPLPAMAATDPEMYNNICTQPWFLFVRASKMAALDKDA